MTDGEAGWEFSDAWVLTAVGLSPRPCTLTGLVAAADGLNHAVPAEQEIEQAIGRLTASGLLTVSEDLEFSLTPAGTDLFARRRGGMSTMADSLLKLLHRHEVRDSPWRLPPGALDAAVTEYDKAVRAAHRRKRPHGRR